MTTTNRARRGAARTALLLTVVAVLAGCGGNNTIARPSVKEMTAAVEDRIRSDSRIEQAQDALGGRYELFVQLASECTAQKAYDSEIPDDVLRGLVKELEGQDQPAGSGEYTQQITEWGEACAAETVEKLRTR